MLPKYVDIMEWVAVNSMFRVLLAHFTELSRTTHYRNTKNHSL